MKTLTKLSIRTLGIIIGSILFFQLIQAAFMPWDGFIVQSKPIIGQSTQFESK